MRLGLKKIILFLLFIPVTFYGVVKAADPIVYYPTIIPTLTGPDTTCSGQGGYTYTTESGKLNYIWHVSPGGAITAGGSSTSNTVTITWNSPGANFVKVIYTTATDTAVKNVTVLQTLPASISITATEDTVCGGTPVTFTATAINGGAFPFYQWKITTSLGTFNVGPNAPVFTYPPQDGDTVYCVFTSSQKCTTGNPASSNKIVIKVNPVIPVSVSVFASANPVCNGTLVTFTATPLNGGSSPVYQWKVNGSNVGSGGTTYSYVPQNGDIVTCWMTSNVTCPSNNPAVSNPVTMIVSPDQPVSVSISASSNPICLGSPVTITAAPTNGGSLPSYEWKINSTIYTQTSGPVLTYTPNNGDVITCKLLSNAPCPTGNPAISNAVVLTVNPYAPVSVSITASEIRPVPVSR